MSLTSKGVFIIGAKRTPFCKHGGALKELPASHAFAAAAKDAIHSAKLNPQLIDATIVGNVNYLSQCDGGKTPRHSGLYSGVSPSKPALGVNKTCGSGLQAVISGAVEIMTGLANVSLTGGTEIMSSLPFVVRNTRFGTALGVNYKFEDYINKVFEGSYLGSTLQSVEENLINKYGLKREDLDQFALESSLKWKAAQQSSIFADEITIIKVSNKKKEVVVDKDDVNVLDLQESSQLPMTLKDGGFVTSKNSAAPADGASALLLANEASLEAGTIQSLVRISDWVCVGVDPVKTGLGAVETVQRLLREQRVGVNHVDLFEINETFASQPLIAIKELQLDPSKVNVRGGALALGHPVAATGARMITHLVHQMRRNNLKRTVAASSCGGGQGIAVMLERV